METYHIWEIIRYVFRISFDTWFWFLDNVWRKTETSVFISLVSISLHLILVLSWTQIFQTLNTMSFENSLFKLPEPLCYNKYQTPNLTNLTKMPEVQTMFRNVQLNMGRIVVISKLQTFQTLSFATKSELRTKQTLKKPKLEP